MLHILDIFAWLACVVYATIPAFWLMVHPFADYWRSRRRNPFLILLPAWVLLWILAGLATAPWHAIRFYSNPLAWMPGALLFALGIWIYKLSSKDFSGSQLGGIDEVRRVRKQQLVTTGIRARVRHPIYLAHLCEMLAWSIGTGLAICFALTAFAILSGALMILLEDRELESRFGVEYQDYRTRVPAILPLRRA